MKKFISGAIVGVIIGALIQDKVDAKDKTTRFVVKTWEWMRKQINSMKENVKENIDDIKEEVGE